MTTLPLAPATGAADVLAYCDRPVPFEAFARDVAAQAGRLPKRGYVINLCEDRYRFLVGFAAALSRGQTTLLPPSRAPRVVEQIAAAYAGCYCLADGESAAAVETVRYDVRAVESGEAPLVFPAERTAAIVFTSGSTGVPSAHPKTWGSLVGVAGSTGRRLGLDRLDGVTFVATVPPQHMFGLEASIMLPLQFGMPLHAGRPFFPEDVRAALAQQAGPKVLVTTPLHLRTLVEAGTALDGIEFILCATAPLPVELAGRAERAYGTRVLEVYGCTEAGVVATRRPTEGSAWRLLDELRMQGSGEECYIESSYLPAPLCLNDVVEPLSERTFHLAGRKQDLVIIAGKRMSLSDLNHQLNDIAGVDDGVFFLPGEGESDATRLAALAVAPGMTVAAILKELRQRIDPVFLPRPLRLVPSLPRNETGKLPLARLRQLLAGQ